MPRCVRVVAPALAALLMLACGTTALRRTTVAPARLQSVRDSAAAQFRDPGTYLKAHLRDGRAYVFDHWSLAGGTVSGTGRVLDANRTQVAQGALALPLDSAVLFESDAVQTASAVGLLTVPTIVTVAIGAMCAANPKAY